jgi:2-polyprenyl-3-methyl-5-hydroxy-6-metoxy-1,4-benzoquinol methylase
VDIVLAPPGAETQQLTDWAAVWRELVERRARGHGGNGGADDQHDPWAGRAREFGDRVRRRWSGSDSSREFVLGRVEAGATVLDIGAGTGAWSIMLARKASRVTAIDASPAMLHVLRENLLAEGVTNVAVVPGRWPYLAVEPHDYTLCSHAMYGSPDLPAFVERMMGVTRRSCFLVLRAPLARGIMAEAAEHLWGHPLDSPNFTVAFNVLLEMGLTPNVLMETGGTWDARTSTTLDEALARMRRHFGLDDSAAHDAYFRQLLGRRLERRDGRLVWERDMRSALVYWDVA